MEYLPSQIPGFIGDEPNNRRSGNENQHPKVSSDLIKVLPKWTNYQPASRLFFKKAVLSMLRACQATWLLKNVQRKVADVHASGVTRTKALDTPFTPAPLRPRTQPAPPTSPVGRSNARGVAQVLWRTPARTHTQARDRATAHQGSSAYERAAHKGSSAYERAAQRASAYEHANQQRASAYEHANQQRVSAYERANQQRASAHKQASQPRSMGQLASDAAWARAAQREQKRPERQPSN